MNKKKRLVKRKHRKARLRLKAKKLELLKNKKSSVEEVKASKAPPKKAAPKKAVPKKAAPKKKATKKKKEKS
ncbi:MAG: hypothetical protein VX703_03175 [Candidatus Neomarinimicrobiota bacterium]|nr:hypothetical protein [Candidatus Neomarinimicrobiota bacterium]